MKFLALIMHNWQNFWGETPDPDRKASAALPIPLLWAGLCELVILVKFLALIMHNWQNFWGETPNPDRKNLQLSPFRCCGRASASPPHCLFICRTNVFYLPTPLRDDLLYFICDVIVWCPTICAWASRKGNSGLGKGEVHVRTDARKGGTDKD